MSRPSSRIASLAVVSNDMMMSVYLAAIMRTVVSLHSLIENKEARASTERAAIAAEAKALEAEAKKDQGDKDKENKGEQNGAAKATGAANGTGDGDSKMEEM